MRHYIKEEVLEKSTFWRSIDRVIGHCHIWSKNPKVRIGVHLTLFGTFVFVVVATEYLLIFGNLLIGCGMGVLATGLIMTVTIRNNDILERF